MDLKISNISSQKKKKNPTDQASKKSAEIFEGLNLQFDFQICIELFFVNIGKVIKKQTKAKKAFMKSKRAI